MNKFKSFLENKNESRNLLASSTSRNPPDRPTLPREQAPVLKRQSKLDRP